MSSRPSWTSALVAARRLDALRVDVLRIRGLELAIGHGAVLHAGADTSRMACGEIGVATVVAVAEHECRFREARVPRPHLVVRVDRRRVERREERVERAAARAEPDAAIAADDRDRRDL